MNNIKSKDRVSNKYIYCDDILLKNRELFLYESVGQKTSLSLIKKLRALDIVSNKPIKLWIDSPGGVCSDGLAIINTIRHIKSHVITIINTKACSMASMISAAGNERWVYANSIWMGHDATAGTHDYTFKVQYTAHYIKKLWIILEQTLKKYSKLTDKDLHILRTGELWLFGKDIIKKGLADNLIS